MKKRIEKARASAYCVSGHYLNLDGGNRAFDFEMRNADVTYRDRSTTYGQAVDIKVYDYTKNPSGDLVEHIQVYRPEVRLNRGCIGEGSPFVVIDMQGFLSVVRANGKLLDPEHGNPELPMRLVNLTLRPEAALDDAGRWKED